MSNPDNIPRKSLFRVDEVCQIAGIKPYILRFWETEFTEITPINSSSGKKVYERKDLILISLIKQLLFDKKMTIEKAKAEIKGVNLDKLLDVKKENLTIVNDEVESEVNEIKEPTRVDILKESNKVLVQLLAKTNSIKKHYNWV